MLPLLPGDPLPAMSEAGLEAWRGRFVVLVTQPWRSDRTLEISNRTSIQRLGALGDDGAVLAMAILVDPAGTVVRTFGGPDMDANVAAAERLADELSGR